MSTLLFVGDTPTGTVTFLFTDIEGSTRLWEERPDEMRVALAEHDALVRRAIDAHGGYVFSTGGDGFGVAFSRAHHAVDAALKAQAALADHPLIRVRMGIHTGEVQERDGDYFGPAVNRAARIMAAGHGGQVVVSLATEEIVGGSVGLRDLGGHRLKDLGAPERIFQLGDAVFPPLRTLDAVPGNLPVETTEFIGRERELSRVADAVGAHRVVTLTGVGGVGKTRLAIHAAAELVPRFAGGVWFVDLAELDDPARVAAQVGRVLGIRQRPGDEMVDSLVDVLATQQLLVVLDNCEHVLGSANRVAQRLVRDCADLAVLATSREPLGVPGEVVVTVPSLQVDAAVPEQCEAVQLFAARAAAAGANLSDRDDPRVVAELCRRLDGIPLAIELAAARRRAMSTQEILDRIDRRFRLLSRGGAGALDRHQTLRAAIDWSFALLDERERAVLARLAVFVGGFDLDAAEAVCAGGEIDELNVMEIVLRLVDKSLVVADPVQARTRYRLLETIRQYLVERVEDPEAIAAVRDAHAAHYLAMARRLGPRLVTEDEREAFDRLDADAANLMAAEEWLVASDAQDDVFELYSVMPFMWWSRTAVESVERVGRALAGLAGDAAGRLPVVALAARLAVNTARPDQAAGLVEKGFGLADELGVDPPALLLEAWSMQDTWRSPQAMRVALRRGLDRAVSSQNPFDGARLASLLAWVEAAQGDRDACERYARQAEQLARSTGSPSVQVGALFGRAYALLFIDASQSVPLAAEAVDLLENAPLAEAAWALNILARAQAHTGDPAALATFRRTIERARRDGMLWAVWTSLRGIAHELAATGRYEDAFRVFAFAASKDAGNMSAEDATWLTLEHQMRAHIDAHVNPERQLSLAAEGEAMNLDSVLALIDS